MIVTFSAFRTTEVPELETKKQTSEILFEYYFIENVGKIPL